MVMMDDPLAAVKVTSPAPVVSRMGGDIKKIATRLNVNLLIGSKRKQVVLEGGDPAEYLSANANQLFKGVFCPAANLLCRAAYEANLVALVPAALVVVVRAVPVDPRPKEKFLQGHLLSPQFGSCRRNGCSPNRYTHLWPPGFSTVCANTARFLRLGNGVLAMKTDYLDFVLGTLDPVNSLGFKELFHATNPCR